MRYFLAGSLIVILGSWAGSARGQEGQEAVRMERPVALNGPAPAASIGRPVAISESAAQVQPSRPIQDPGFKPATFTVPPIITLDPPHAQAGGTLAPQPLPAGPVLDNDGAPVQAPANGNSVSRRLVPQPIETTPSPRLLPSDPASVPTGVDCIDGATCCDQICDDSCCGLFGCRGSCFMPPPSRFWISAEYLAWWTKGQNFPPLVTTSPVGTPRAMAGVLGAPGTEVLLGGHGLDNGEQSGGRFTAGFWFDRDESIGLEGSYFFLAKQFSSFDAASSGSPILARPFIDVLAGAEASELIAFPGVLAGSIHVSSTTLFQGADIDLRTNLWRGCCWRIDLLTGFRYLSLDDSLSITENLAPTAGGNIIVNDGFKTRNNFYGGQVGIDLQFRRGRWSLNLMEKIALGDTHEQVSINGSTLFMPTVGPASIQPGGLLAQASNIGSFSQDRFAVAPETGIKVGYQLTDHIQVFAAYSFVYLSNVIDPAHVIDRGVNVTQLPSQLGPGTLVGTPRPFFIFKGSDFWAQGVSIGFEIRF